MRAPIRGATACVCALALLFSSAREARAQQCSNPLTSTCINADAFWPNAGPQRFAAVGSAETLAPQQIGFALMTTYLSRPVIIRSASPGPGGSNQNAIDNMVDANFLFAYGVTDRLQLDVVAPITLVQTGTGTSPLTGGRSIHDTAVRDMRFGFAYSLVPRVRSDLDRAADEGGKGKAFAVVSRFGFSAPMGDNDDFAGERSVVFIPSIAGDYRVWRFFFGLDLGARIRPVTEFGGARVGTQLTGSAGAGFEILPRQLLSVMLEGRSYYGFAEQHDTESSTRGFTSTPNGRHILPSEWTLGVRSAPVLDGDMSFFAGGGGPIPGAASAITIPRFRFMLGINYAPMQRDSDGDGVPDRIDRCPSQQGERSGERPGCPPEPPTTVRPQP